MSLIPLKTRAGTLEQAQKIGESGEEMIKRPRNPPAVCPLEGDFCIEMSGWVKKGNEERECVC